MLLIAIIAGIGFPQYAFAIDIIYVIGRLLFSIGYMSSGPSGRLTGALICDFAILANLGLSVASCVKLI